MIRFKVNGQMVESSAPPTEPLLQILANDLGLNGQKYGCGKAQCGACTVLINGDPQRSCVFPLSAASGRSVVTLQGLSEAGAPSRLQQAFVQEQAAQCGYCLNGMIMTTVALLANTPNPSDLQMQQALSGNLCRCGAHIEISDAVRRAVALMSKTAFNS